MTITLTQPALKEWSDDAIVLRASAKVVAAIEVNRSERLEEIAPLRIWTADSVRTGWTFDPNTGSLCWWCRSPLVEPLRLVRSRTTQDAPPGCNYRYPPHGQSRCTTTIHCGTLLIGFAKQSPEG
jgi:hypothetical protein